MSFNVVIPARLKSSRLKEKVLIEIHGIPMVIHVAQRASLSGAKNIVIATDDKKIVQVASHYNFKLFDKARNCSSLSILSRSEIAKLQNCLSVFNLYAYMPK